MSERDFWHLGPPSAGSIALTGRAILRRCSSACALFPYFFRNIAQECFSDEFGSLQRGDSIRKGYVTTRNKYMRCEKLYYGYEPRLNRFITVKATRGNVELRDVSQLLTRRVLRFGQPSHLHALFDAGAGKSDADVRSLMDLADATPNLNVTLRACRHPHRVKLWKRLPSGLFTSYEEPGVSRDAPPKEELDQREVLEEFRHRQHHEQGYRVQVHDEFLNAATCGYDKQSPDRKRPRFCREPLQMVGWIAALVYNACADFAGSLGPDWEGVFIRTLRHEFFNQPGRLYLTPTAFIVYFDHQYGEHHPLLSYIDRINAEQHRIPWLDNRLVVMSVDSPAHNPRAGP